jgi:hypothetical protein
VVGVTIGVIILGGGTVTVLTASHDPGSGSASGNPRSGRPQAGRPVDPTAPTDVSSDSSGDPSAGVSSAAGVSPGDGVTPVPGVGPGTPSTSPGQRTSPPVPSGAAGEFSLALSAPSGPVVAGSQLSFTVDTGVVSGAPGTLTLAVTGLPAAASAAISPQSINAGAKAQVTITTSGNASPGTYPVSVTATASAARHSATYSLTINAAQVVVNGGFESGLSGWNASGSASTVGSPVHGGGTAVLLGRINGSGETTITQTVTVAGTGALSFWYDMICDDRVQYDWFDAWATDLSTNQTVDLVRKTCATSGSYQQVTATLTSGHRYKIVVENHDDNYSQDSSYTYVDDVSVT